MVVRLAQAGSAVQRAVRTDREAGFREEVEFVGDGERLFCCGHLPLGPARAGVLICSPLHADFMANYQREVTLARLLASRGIAVQRFHYRGTGNSDGRPDAITLQAMCDDALEAADQLVRAFGVALLGLVGTRWGALVAARLAERFPGAPVVLWEPTTDPAQYFREAFRSKLMRDAKEGNGPPVKSATIRELLEREGEADLLGYPVHRALYESVRGTTLVGSLTGAQRAALIVQFRGGIGIQAAYSGLASELQARGYDVTLSTAGLTESWWFHSDNPAPSGSLLDLTTAWLTAKVGSTP